MTGEVRHITEALEARQARRTARLEARFDEGVFLTHLNKGRQHVEAGRLREARSSLEQALVLRSTDERVLNLLGLIYSKLGLRSEAFGVYRSLVQLHPEADVLHANLGILEFREGRHEDARRRFETALLLNPNNVRPHLYLGLIERVQGNLERCLGHLRAAGAPDLARRIEAASTRHDAAGSLAEEPEDTVRTGPLARVDIEEDRPASRDAGDISLLERPERIGEPDGNVFSVIPPQALEGCDTLVVDIRDAVRVRAGCAAALHIASGTMRAEPNGPRELLTLRGRGRVELIPPDPRKSAVILIPWRDERPLFLCADRLLAFDGAAPIGDGAAGTTPYDLVRGAVAGGMPLAGRRAVALAAGRGVRAVRLRGEETLVARASDLVCWTGDLRVRPLPPCGLEEVILPSSDGGLVRLEGAGQILLDVPGA